MAVQAVLEAPRNLSTASPQEVGLSASGLERVDDALQKLIDAGELAGAVTLVARHGRVAWQRAMGFKDLASGERLQTDTLFRIYSMTKPVTAVAMMMLYEEGRWRPTDPIGKFLPGFDEMKVLVGVGADGEPIFEPAVHAPTLGALMSHTAGFSYGFDPAEAVTPFYRAADIWRSPSLAEFAGRIAALPLAYQPGKRWLYSVSMDLQGAIIEALTGMSLPRFMHERIFAPLSMTDTAFHTPPEKAGRLATLYRMSESRGLVVMESLLLPDRGAPPALASGGGGLISTAGDYARFAQMLLDGGVFGGARLLTPGSVALMTANHLSEDLMCGAFGVGHQAIRPGFGYGYNGAVFTDPELAGVPVGAGTYQWDGAAGTWFWIDPVNDLLFVGLVQRMDPKAPPLQTMTQRLMAQALA
jgi:CubicO group peptidase (beta-lactamase class C family)